MLAALTTEGVLASMSVESPTDGDVFLAFVEQVLTPQLQPGHLVIFDNLGALDRSSGLPKEKLQAKEQKKCHSSWARIGNQLPQKAAQEHEAVNSIIGRERIGQFVLIDALR